MMVFVEISKGRNVVPIIKIHFLYNLNNFNLYINTRGKTWYPFYENYANSVKLHTRSVLKHRGLWSKFIF